MRSRILLPAAGTLFLASLAVAMLATDLRARPKPAPAGRDGGILGRVVADRPWKAYVMPWGSGFPRPVAEGPPGFFLARALSSGVYKVTIAMDAEADGTPPPPPGSGTQRTRTLVVPVHVPEGIRMEDEPSPSGRASIQEMIDRFRETYLAKDTEKLAGFYSTAYMSVRGETLRAKLEGLRRELEKIEVRKLDMRVDLLMGTDDHAFLVLKIDIEGVGPRVPGGGVESVGATALELVRDPPGGDWRIQSSGAIPVPPFEERWVKEYEYLPNSPLAAVSVEPGRITKIPGTVDLRHD